MALLMRVSAPLVAALLVALQLSAQTQPPVQIGAGSQGCGQWLDVTDKGDRRNQSEDVAFAMMFSWVQGFVVGSVNQLTAVMAGTSDLAARQAKFKTVSGLAFDPPDAKGLQYWIVKYCRDHPLADLDDTAQALVVELFTKK